MKFLSHSRRFTKKLGKAFPEPSSALPASIADHLPLQEKSSPVLKTVSWGAAAMGMLAIGVVVGREIRIRYKFNRRTPYDLYAHSGDERDVDFGLGV
jgi:hypothetical protein